MMSIASPCLSSHREDLSYSQQSDYLLEAIPDIISIHANIDISRQRKQYGCVYPQCYSVFSVNSLSEALMAMREYVYLLDGTDFGTACLPEVNRFEISRHPSPRDVCGFEMRYNPRSARGQG
jgi:hypothetical protein